MKGNSKEKKYRQKGLSIIELIIVILCVAILATLAFPSVQRNLQLFRMETGSGSVTFLLAMARMEAIKRNRDVTVVIDQTQKIATIKSKNYRNEEISLAENLRLSDDISFAGSNTSSITFTSLGRNKSNTESRLLLQLTGTNKRRQIKVSSGGQISANPY